MANHPSEDWKDAESTEARSFGERINHFQITGELGHGGMGVVYRAEDTRLQRTVALKFLSPELTSDPEAKQRLITEARAASRLDHPNICTIYEIDETPDGRLFLAMPSYQGETLKQRIERGPLNVNDAVEFALQLAQGLRKAHEAGFVHRDIKTSNLFVTADGILKILDFGLAKRADQSGLTQTGVVIGTIAYMSPEQLNGIEADQRSDLWAAGVVFYEMLTGRSPFGDKHDVVLMQAILNEEPLPAPGIPTGLQSVVKRLLQKAPAARYQTATELVDDLAQLRLASAKTPSSAGRQHRKSTIAAAVLVAVVVVIGAAIWLWSRQANLRWARNEAVPEVARLVETGNYPEAFALAGRVRPYVPDDPMLRSLTPHFSATFSITTGPPDAKVYVRRYESTGDWEFLGNTPLESVSLPRQALRWKIEKAGFELSEFATAGEADRAPGGSPKLDVTLQKSGSKSGMVYVPGGTRTLGFGMGSLELPPFLIDRYEVTNQAFKEFMDAGGYSQKSYWEGIDFIKDGKRLSWEEAMMLFVDSTKRSGPRTWELGDYPEGKDAWPVTGVSWYEAAAYARYRGKTLPTFYHWNHAATTAVEQASSLAVSIIPLSNFSGMGTEATGHSQAMGPFGTYDMYGNVREWLWNPSPNGGWLLGGSWNDASYTVYGLPPEVPLFDRSETNGIRLMNESAPAPSTAVNLRGPVDLRARMTDFGVAKPVSDQVFEGYREQFNYRSEDPHPSEVSIVETREDWIQQRVTIDAGYNRERMNVYVFLPKDHKPPFQPLVYFPGLNAFFTKPATDGREPLITAMNLDFIVKSGRAIVYPVYSGAFERNGPVNNNTGEFLQRVIHWRWDLGRTLDYLESRDDMDMSRAGYLGVSFGASYALPALAMEKRFKAALLLSGGFGIVRVFPPADPIHYAPRITIPVLMINGEADTIVPLESNQRPLFRLLGSTDKRHEILKSGHVFFPRKQFLDLALPWLDKHLGPVR
jgi:serine/threonine protein kinase/formylglycine-generating enzyme required for sulfatase activity/pimeloyl-ACP methyl ester carboxylesterase